MTPTEMEARIVRYGELIPCRTAFIDAHTPGSNQKENFTIIGGGVSESPDQHVHINDTPGFNIGAAGQPPRVRNSLHTHRTAEVFFILSGRWRFFWGRDGTSGEVILEEGDIINIPTRMFRGFENIGTDYAMIMAVLGGDDAGGGVLWAPQVIEEAREHGLILGNNGALYDSKLGQTLPEGVKPMPLMKDEELAQLNEPSVEEVVNGYVARYQDMMAFSASEPCDVIGSDALIKDRPGFEIDFHWRLNWDGGTAVLNPGDTCAIPPNLAHSVEPSMSGEASLYRVRNTEDKAGLTGALL